MKIVLVDNFFYRGVGSTTALFDTKKILEERGHTVACFSTLNPKNEPSPWSKYFVSYYDLEAKQGIINGFKIILRFFYNFEARKKFSLLLDEFKPDIIHFNNIYHHLSPSIIPEAKKRKIPTVMTLHDYKLVSPNYSLFVRGEIYEKTKQRKYYRCVFDRCVKDSYLKSLICAAEAYAHHWLRVYEKVDYYISPSEFLKNKFKEFGFKKEIGVVPNVLYDIPTEPELSSGKHILYLGRLSQEKGVADLLKAFSRLKTKEKLVVIGFGPESENLKNLAKNKGIKDRVEFLGRIYGQERDKYIKNAKFVVVPSKWYENYPYVVIEAMALTKCVLCANIGGLKDMIKHGKTGLLYRFGDVDDLKNKMEYLLFHEEEKNKIAINAYERVKKENNKETYYQRLLNIYNKLIIGAK